MYFDELICRKCWPHQSMWVYPHLCIPQDGYKQGFLSPPLTQCLRPCIGVLNPFIIGRDPTCFSYISKQYYTEQETSTNSTLKRFFLGWVDPRILDEEQKPSRKVSRKFGKKKVCPRIRENNLWNYVCCSLWFYYIIHGSLWVLIINHQGHFCWGTPKSPPFATEAHPLSQACSSL